MAQAQKRVAIGAGISDESPVGRAFNRGQLNAGSRQYTAWDRYTAGRKFSELWNTVHSIGCSGALRERVSTSFRPGGEAERKAIARDLLKQLEERLSRDAQYVLRAFLVDHASGSEAISARLDGAEKSVWLAICVYLDGLIDAMCALGVHRFRDVSCATND